MALTIRTEIVHAAILLSSLVQNPGNCRRNAAKGCLRYLKGTKSEKTIFGKTGVDRIFRLRLGNIDNRKVQVVIVLNLTIVQVQSVGLVNYKCVPLL